jgi:hypothetical protein
MANSIAQMLLFIALLYLLQGKPKEALSDRVVLPPHWLSELVNVLSRGPGIAGIKNRPQATIAQSRVAC